MTNRATRAEREKGGRLGKAGPPAKKSPGDPHQAIRCSTSPDAKRVPGGERHSSPQATSLERSSFPQINGQWYWHPGKFKRVPNPEPTHHSDTVRSGGRSNLAT